MNQDPPIRLCIFDLGGVIIRLKGLDTYRQMPGFPQHMNTDEVIAWFEDLPEFVAWETGRADVDTFAAATIKGLGLDVAMPEFIEMLMEMIQEPIPGMEELVCRVAKQVPTVALSNANELHWPKIMRDYPAVKHFHRIFASQQIGLRKPNPDCFCHVLDAMRVRPEETLFFDDTQMHIDAAARLGIRAVRFQDPEQCARSLAQAVDL